MQRTIVAFALAAVAASGASGGAHPETLAAWKVYVAAVDRRVARELAARDGFLALDFDPAARGDRQTVRGGQLVTRHVRMTGDRGEPLPMPGGLVHHWRGAVMIPGLRLADLMASLQRDVPDLGQADVLRAAVLERGPDTMRVFLELQRTRFVTVVYDTEHLVRFRHHGEHRASSASTAVRITEVADAGTAREHRLPAGQDHGFLWEWNAYWRYEESTAGVIVECESVSLSRDVPAIFQFVAEPLIESTARDSMERTLNSMRRHFSK